MSTRPRRDDWHPGGEIPTGDVGDRLAAVLRAAAAPAHAEELAGEEAAVAAFRAATETSPGHASKVRSVLAKVLTVKAVIVLAVAGSAGVVAATSDMLPTPWSPAPSAEQSSSPAPTPAPKQRSANSGSPTSPTTPDSLSTTELCQEYAGRDRPDNALKNPTFRSLITAAGGEGKVSDYCATRAKQFTDTKNDHKGKPVGKGKPTDITGKPQVESATKPKKADGNNQTTEPSKPKNTGDTSKTDNSRRSTSASARSSTPGSPAHGTVDPPGPPSGARPSQGGG